jgi:hypothetical protein
MSSTTCFRRSVIVVSVMMASRAAPVSVGSRIPASRMAPADSGNAYGDLVEHIGSGFVQSALDLTEHRPFGQLPHRYRC